MHREHHSTSMRAHITCRAPSPFLFHFRSVQDSRKSSVDWPKRSGAAMRHSSLNASAQPVITFHLTSTTIHKRVRHTYKRCSRQDRHTDHRSHELERHRQREPRQNRNSDRNKTDWLESMPYKNNAQQHHHHHHHKPVDRELADNSNKRRLSSFQHPATTSQFELSPNNCQLMLRTTNSRRRTDWLARRPQLRYIAHGDIPIILVLTKDFTCQALNFGQLHQWHVHPNRRQWHHEACSWKIEPQLDWTRCTCVWTMNHSIPPSASCNNMQQGCQVGLVGQIRMEGKSGLSSMCPSFVFCVALL